MAAPMVEFEPQMLVIFVIGGRNDGVSEEEGETVDDEWTEAEETVSNKVNKATKTTEITKRREERYICEMRQI